MGAALPSQLTGSINTLFNKDMKADFWQLWVNVETVGDEDYNADIVWTSINNVLTGEHIVGYNESDYRSCSETLIHLWR